MRARALMLVILMLTMSLAGCFGNDKEPETSLEQEILDDPRIFVTDRTGASLEQSPIEMTFQFSDVGETGKEPSIGITSSGCISVSYTHLTLPTIA